jgi:magnesium transporter
MVFYSQIVGREIIDNKGTRIARLKDLVLDFSKKLPVVTDLVFKDKLGKLRKISWKYLDSLEKTGIFLNEEEKKLITFDVADSDTLLEDMILDQQVVDIDGLKMVRVNDVVLEKVDNEFCFISIDIGIKGILRRLGLSSLNKTLLSKQPQRQIKWENVESLNAQLKNIRLNVHHQKMAELHPADIADFIEDLSHKERALVFKGLDYEKAADTLEESEPNIQKSVVRHLKKERIARILESMAPDEAVDLLIMFPPDKINEFLCLMEPNKAEALKGILKYDKDLAGGIMSTEYVSVPKEYTADQAILLVREKSAILEKVHNLYVVDQDHHLLGVVSMKDLILNKADSRLEDIMIKKIIQVHTNATIRHIEALFKKYNLFSLPVVNEEKKLVGIITHDDIFDIVLPAG